MRAPTLNYERKLWGKGYDIVIGVDEVGRGALAGPVTAAAVVFSPSTSLSKKALDKPTIIDSKQLRPAVRLSAENWIRKNCLCCIVRSTDVRLIDRDGIARATRQAIRSAIRSVLTREIAVKPFLLADAFHIKYVQGIGLQNQAAIVKGDLKVFSIAAASILAKTQRDRLMKKLSREFPVYGWGRNKGYGTKEHREAIRTHGLTEHHRRSFTTSVA